VVLDEELEGQVLAPVHKVEPGRLGDEPHGAQHDKARSALEDEGDAPLPVAVDKVAAVRDDRSGNRSAKPTEVVETWNC
jgi:hypothetical protein